MFLPRIFPNFAFGYGYPVLNYYAPLSYYPAALMHLAGAGLEQAVLAGVALFLAISALGMYLFLRIWVTPFIAVAVTVLSMFAPYRLYNLSVRGALPEYAAFAWIPLIALAITKLVQACAASESDPDGTRGADSVPVYAVLMATACAGLILTHYLTALMVALALGASTLFVVLGAAIGRARRGAMRPSLGRYGDSHWWLGLAPVALFALAGAGLAAFHVVPAVLGLDWVGIGQGSGAYGFLDHLTTARALFTWSVPHGYPSAADATAPASGLVLVINLGLLLLVVGGRESTLRTAAAVSLLISALGLAMMTDISASLWMLGSSVLGKLQFPWRWHAIVTFSVIWGVALLLQWLRTFAPDRAVPVLYAVIAVASGAFIWYAVDALPRAPGPVAAESLTTEAMWAFDDSVGQVGASWTGEFLPTSVTEQRWAIGRPPSEQTGDGGAGDAEGSLRGRVSYVRPVRAGYLDATYETRADIPLRLIFHTFYFPAWRVDVDGRRAATVAVSNLGLLAVDLPPGEHVVAVRLAPTVWGWAGWALSATACLIVLLYLALRRPRRRALAGAWALLGGVFAILWLLPAAARRPRPSAQTTGQCAWRRRQYRPRSATRRRMSTSPGSSPSPTNPSPHLCTSWVRTAASWRSTTARLRARSRRLSDGCRAWSSRGDTRYRCPQSCRPASTACSPASTRRTRPAPRCLLRSTRRMRHPASA